SPFAQSLMFGWIAQYMYEGDAPLAERRAAALSLDRDLLRDLLGAEELRELLDPDVIADTQAELQRTAEAWRARTVDHLEDLLRWLGPLTMLELDQRIEGLDLDEALAQLRAQRRLIDVVVCGQSAVAAPDDASRLRDALGVALPPGLPAAFTESVADPLGDLVSRYARTNGPFLIGELAQRLGIDADRAAEALGGLEQQGRVVRGEFRPSGHEREWCHVDVLRTLRRRSLAALRREVEPVEQDALARFLPSWQHVGSRRRGVEALAEVITTLQGAALPASSLETDILPARMGEYRSADLDTLLTAGELVWIGAGGIGVGDGRIRLVWRDQVPVLVPDPPGGDDHLAEPLPEALRNRLAGSGASFWSDLVAAAQAAGCDYDDQAVLTALWDLVWAGEVTNDSLTPVRSLLAGSTPSSPTSKSRRGARRGPSRPNLRALSRLGPPSATGRWSLVEPLRQPLASPTERATTAALQLLERYGVLTREMALAEGAEGGFAGMYPILKELEERGQVRRGYFVAGLGAAQFALPGAVDRLRDHRDRGVGEATGSSGRAGSDQSVTTDDPGAMRVLAACDPAQPYGAALPWPPTEGRPSRSVGSYVILHRGVPVVYLERGGRSLTTFTGAGVGSEPLDGGAWVSLLSDLVTGRRLRAVEIGKVDGRPVAEAPQIRTLLLSGGFKDGYRGVTFR
ncbi:MAG: DEAD/DEAH box helicase, partial [Acidimicrobiia bacterium]|nr:DEAD/DEAH box helicase [Acidimicrobiia bacterium]